MNERVKRAGVCAYVFCAIFKQLNITRQLMGMSCTIIWFLHNVSMQQTTYKYIRTFGRLLWALFELNVNDDHHDDDDDDIQYLNGVENGNGFCKCNKHYNNNNIKIKGADTYPNRADMSVKVEREM